MFEVIVLREKGERNIVGTWRGEVVIGCVRRIGRKVQCVFSGEEVAFTVANSLRHVMG